MYKAVPMSREYWVTVYYDNPDCDAGIWDGHANKNAVNALHNGNQVQALPAGDYVIVWKLKIPAGHTVQATARWGTSGKLMRRPDAQRTLLFDIEHDARQVTVYRTRASG
jgi:hypothetical protein